MRTITVDKAKLLARIEENTANSYTSYFVEG